MALRVPLALIVLVPLAGCAGMADVTSRFAGLGVISEEVQSFDAATVVQMSPMFLYREGQSMFGGVHTKMGARWNSKTPRFVGLVLSYSGDVSGYRPSYIGFDGLDINIDGVISEHKTSGQTGHDNSGYNSVSRTIYTKSENVVVVPLETLEKMLQAKDCRLRVHTSKGSEDVHFSVERMPGGQGTAIVPMRDFLASVKSKAAGL